MSRLLGKRYETIALTHLQHAGLTFIAANVNVKNGELDLIMQDHSTWVFVEVRYRKNARYGSASASITPVKQARLLKAAELWLQHTLNESFATADCRFDIFAITGDHIEWIKNAFGVRES